MFHDRTFSCRACTDHCLRSALAAAALVGVTAAGRLQAQVQYTVTVLPDPPGDVYTVEPQGLNDLGEVVGWAHITFGDPIKQAWEWTPAGGTVLLPPSGLGNYGAFDINNAGQIAGDSSHPSGEAAWILQDGAYTLIPLLGSNTWAQVTGINALRQVAGLSDDYTPSGSSNDLFFHGPNLGLLEIAPDTTGVIGRINGPGQVILSLAGDAYVWSPDAGLQLVGDPPGSPCTSAKAINDREEIAGTSWLCTQSSNRVVWLNTESEWQTIVDLTPTSRAEVVRAINNLGVVVGHSNLLPDHAWVWSASQGVRVLDDVIDRTGLPSYFHLYEAVDVNDSGQILAEGTSLSGGVRGAFLLTPIGDPRIYCVGKTNSRGCTPAVTWSGTPTFGGTDDFVIEGLAKLNQQFGVMIWGRAGASTPFQGGTLCIAPPVRRSPVLGSGGSLPPEVDCSGRLAFFFSQAYMVSHSIGPGDSIFCQFWSRDPADAFGSSLSNALSFTVLP